MLAVTLLVLAYGIFGSMGALAAARQRSTFLELANAEVEAMRALDYEAVGVDPDDPNFESAYGPGGQFEGRSAVTTETDGLPPYREPPSHRRRIRCRPNGGLEWRVRGEALGDLDQHGRRGATCYRRRKVQASSRPYRVGAAWWLTWLGRVHLSLLPRRTGQAPTTADSHSAIQRSCDGVGW